MDRNAPTFQTNSRFVCNELWRRRVDPKILHCSQRFCSHLHTTSVCIFLPITLMIMVAVLSVISHQIIAPLISTIVFSVNARSAGLELLVTRVASKPSFARYTFKRHVDSLCASAPIRTAASWCRFANERNRSHERRPRL
jgi:hypothetical protein